MEINASTTGGSAATALIENLGQEGSPVTPTTLTTDQQTAVQTAVEVLLSQAGIVDTDPVEVHLASNPDGKWAVLRVAVVKQV